MQVAEVRHLLIQHKLGLMRRAGTSTKSSASWLIRGAASGPTRSQADAGPLKLYEDAIDAAAVARAIVFAVEQLADVDVNEIIGRTTRQNM